MRLLGSDFASPVNGEVMAKQLYRLAAVFGDPWGKDKTMLEQMANEWFEAMSDLPAATVERGISSWIKDGDKWPKPSDIRKRAQDQVERRVSKVSDEKNIHPRRLKPSEEMKNFMYQESPLRRNQNWASFLDTIHPSLEHCYFVKAKIGQFENEVELEYQFHVDYLNQLIGDKLQKHFGRRVILKSDTP